MKLTIEGSPEEIKKILQAIVSSEEQKEIKVSINRSLIADGYTGDFTNKNNDEWQIDATSS